MRAVLFDLDGCLADSEVLCLRAIAEVLAGYGVTGLGWQEVRDRFLGQSLPEIARQLQAETGVAIPPDFAATFEARVLPLYQAGLQPVPGALDLLQALGPVPMAIATGGSRRRMGFTLEIAGLAGFFPGRGFSAEEVPRGKPHPDLFLHAARALGVAPQDCIVVEDSPHGILGAVRAGMRALGFTGGSHLAGLAPAHARRLSEAGAAEVHPTLAAVQARLLALL